MSGGRAWDVVVVGAGPAGSVAARGLAREGFRVLLLDRSSFPRRKVCGACMGPAARAYLHREGLGGLPERLGAVELPLLELRSGSHRAEIALDGHCALGRARLDAALVEEAVSEGVVFRDGTSVRLVVPADPDPVRGCVRVETDDGALEARVVLDAAGLRGTRLGSGPGAGEPSHEDAVRVVPGARIGLGADFAGDELPGGAEPGVRPGVLSMVTGTDGYVGRVCIEDGSLNVAAALAPEAVRARGARGAVAEILAEAGCALPDGHPLDGWAGTPALTRRRARLGGGGVLRIGDAAGYVEPFTGEGIGWALAAAIAVRPFAAAAVGGWREDIADGWTREHHRAVGRGQRTCRALAGGLRRERLVRATVAMLARAPGMAAPLVRATGGGRSR